MTENLTRNLGNCESFMGKKCNHKVGDLVYFTSKYGADNQYCIITYIEELTSYNTVGSYESWEKKIWGAWKDSI